MNNVILIGRLTRDPELRRTNSGEAVTSFTLAVNRTYESEDGQKADYPNCVIWGKGAENVDKYCSKGSLVGVEGRLRTRHYDNAQGNRIYVTEVVCQRVQFLDTKKKEETQQQVSQDNFYDKNFVIEDDDIDF